MKPNGHGHVTPNENGAKARCGGPGICSKCQQEALDLPRAQILCQRTEEPHARRAFPLRFTITGRWHGDPQAAVEVDTTCFRDDFLRLMSEHFGLYPVRQSERGFMLMLSTQNHDVPLVVPCIQKSIGSYAEVAA
jgi:hypothetical protein